MHGKYSSVLLALLMVLGACTTTHKVNGIEVPEDKAKLLEAPTEAPMDALDLHEKRIDGIVLNLGSQHGNRLLRDLHWLIAQKGLATSALVEALPDADDNHKSSLLYVLGFTTNAVSSKALSQHLHHKNPVVRFEASAGLLNQGDATAIPALLDLLESSDKRMRYKTIEALRVATGRDFGYKFAAPEEIRVAAVSDWRTWWEGEKTRLMFRPFPDSTVGAIDR